MSLRRTTIRPIVVLIGWALIVSIATIIPVTSVAAQTMDPASGLATGTSIDGPIGVRTSSNADAPAQVLAFRFDPPADCLYDNSCPEQVGNGEDEDDGPPPRDPYQDARDSRDDGIDKVIDKIVTPNFITYPGFEAQLVGLESFLHLTEGFKEESATGKDVGGQQVTVYATPIESVWEFTSSEGTEIVTCAETEEWSAGDRDPLCGKDWEHSSSVIGKVSLRVTVKYRIHWTHSAAVSAVLSTQGAPVLSNGQSVLRLFTSVALDEALLGSDWTVASLGKGPREYSVVRPSRAMAAQWSAETSREHGLIVHFDIDAHPAVGEHLEARAGDVICSHNADTAAAFATAHASAPLEITAGFLSGDATTIRWQPWFDTAGLDRLSADFGPASQEAVAKILDALADHYAVISNRADWASPWLRRVGLRLASRSSGDVEKLSSSLETAKADLRDL